MKFGQTLGYITVLMTFYHSLYIYIMTLTFDLQRSNLFPFLTLMLDIKYVVSTRTKLVAGVLTLTFEEPKGKNQDTLVAR